MLTALGGSLSAIGNLLNSQFGLNYWVGVGAVIICAGLLCAYGAKLVARASSYMMYLVIAVLAIIIIMSAATGKLHLGQALSNISAGKVAGITPSFLGAIWSTFLPSLRLFPIARPQDSAPSSVSAETLSCSSY